MATLTELQARLEALKAQRDSAVARVSYDGRTVEYRGTAEINSAIADLERELVYRMPSLWLGFLDLLVIRRRMIAQSEEALRRLKAVLEG